MGSYKWPQSPFIHWLWVMGLSKEERDYTNFIFVLRGMHSFCDRFKYCQEKCSCKTFIVHCYCYYRLLFAHGSK